MITGDTTDWPNTKTGVSKVISGSIKLKDIVEVRAVKTKGHWKWRSILIERYVGGKLVGSSWLRPGDNVFITINLEVD